MNRTAEVVIIGGGIRGLSLAYHLAQKGLTGVLVLEMNTLGSGSSGRSAAVIGHAFQSENSLRLTQHSLAAYLRFQEELGAGPGYEPIGYLVLGSPGRASSLRQEHAHYQRLGIESQLLDGAGNSERTPGLNLEDIELWLAQPPRREPGSPFHHDGLRPPRPPPGCRACRGGEGNRLAAFPTDDWTA